MVGGCRTPECCADFPFSSSSVAPPLPSSAAPPLPSSSSVAVAPLPSLGNLGGGPWMWMVRWWNRGRGKVTVNVAAVSVCGWKMRGEKEEIGLVFCFYVYTCTQLWALIVVVYWAFIIIGSPRGTGTGGGTQDPPSQNPTGTDFAPFSSPWGEILPQTHHQIGEFPAGNRGSVPH